MRNSRFIREIGAVLASLVLLGGSHAEEESGSKPEQPAGLESDTLSADDLAFFESKIRPVLVEKCYKCHAADSEKIKGGLVLDTREGIRMGGDSGHAVVPGNLAESLLVAALHYKDEDLEMPPKERLSDEVIADFEEWVLMGAPDPRDGKATFVSSELDIDRGREFWAYKAPERTDAPEVKNSAWPESEIDRYVLAKLEEHHLAPAGDADRRTLIRRIYFDLIGFPPTPEEVEEFVKDPDPDAYRKVVDGLLKMDQFGERWGRHWLDVARYAESSGKENNITFPHAWRYRDYVIDSFNEDKPYNKFLTEQIAGDLLPYEEYSEQAEYLVATGFLAMGPKSLNQQNPRQFKADLVDEQIDTVTRAILGTTVACARCHDHKFDPIPTTDYYAMAGIFGSTDTYYGTVGTQGNRRSSDLLYLAGVDESLIVDDDLTPDQMKNMREELDRVNEERRELFQKVREAQRSGSANENQVANFQQVQRLNSRAAIIQSRLDSVDENGKANPYAMGVWETDYTRDAAVLIRGEIEKISDTVPRGFVQVLCEPGEHKIQSRQDSGRLELAEWIASADNPLTARVMVNRLWHHLFGRGIVPSVDNFGSTGQRPSHPELLDHLALRFVDLDWSIKDMIREIMLSRTYRMTSDFDEESYAADPENTWHWRMSKRRLDAEAIRDAMLSVSGNLDYGRPKGSLVAQAGDGNVGRNVNEQTLARLGNYRSVYLPIVRDLVPEALDLFDFAEPSLVTGSRENTNVPSQALYLMNNPFVIQQSEALAWQLTRGEQRGPELLDKAFNLAFSRPPTEEEARKTKAFFDRFVAAAVEEGYRNDEAGYLALTSYCQTLLAGAEFRYLN